MKLLIINTHPVNYHVPIYQGLGKEADIEVEVGFIWNVFSPRYKPNSEWPIQYPSQLLEGYHSFFIKNYSPFKKGFFEFINWGVISLILSGRYQAVFLFGYNYATAWLVALACHIKKIPLIFKGEGDLSLKRSSLKQVLKKIYLKSFFSLIDYFTYSYKKNADYYLHYGVSPSALYFLPCAVDNVYLQNLSASMSKETIQKNLGLNQSKVVLFVGRLESRKNPLILLDAFNALSDIPNIKLIYVGEGSLSSFMKEKCKQNNFLLKHVIFAGFKPHEEVYQYLMAADVLVLPSFYDPSPKVVNEAMNFSLPIVLSNQIGTSNDLVIEAYNGLVFEPSDAKALELQLRKILLDDALRLQLGNQALQTVNQWSMEENIKVLSALLHSIRKNANA